MTSKRDLIFNATRDLIFEQGLQSISMSQIARRADVGMGTIYNYFASKEELVYSLYREIKMAMNAAVLADYDEGQPVVRRFLQLLTNIAHYGVQHPREFQLVEQLAQVPYVKEQAQADEYALIRVFHQLFAEAQQQHLLKGLPLDVATLLISGALNALIEAHTSDHIQLNDDLIEQAVTSCWDAIKR